MGEILRADRQPLERGEDKHKLVTAYCISQYSKFIKVLEVILSPDFFFFFFEREIPLMLTDYFPPWSAV